MHRQYGFSASSAVTYAETETFGERSMAPFHVNSTTVKYTIPKGEQEEFYFRNFTVVGKKSDGFNITQWDIDHSRLKKRDGVSVLVDGDAVLKYVGAGILAGAALTVACIVVSSACGAYIGTKNRAFAAGLAGLLIEQAAQAAVALTEVAVVIWEVVAEPATRRSSTKATTLFRSIWVLLRG
jgi:hypothetical protein